MSERGQNCKLRLPRMTALPSLTCLPWLAMPCASRNSSRRRSAEAFHGLQGTAPPGAGASAAAKQAADAPTSLFSGHDPHYAAVSRDRNTPGRREARLGQNERLTDITRYRTRARGSVKTAFARTVSARSLRMVVVTAFVIRKYERQ